MRGPRVFEFCQEPKHRRVSILSFESSVSGSKDSDVVSYRYDLSVSGFRDVALWVDVANIDLLSVTVSKP